MLVQRADGERIEVSLDRAIQADVKLQDLPKSHLSSKLARVWSTKILHRSSKTDYIRLYMCG